MCRKVPLGRWRAAFAAVPANRRDSWRLHRVEAGDTLRPRQTLQRADYAGELGQSRIDCRFGRVIGWRFRSAYPGDRTSKGVDNPQALVIWNCGRIERFGVRPKVRRRRTRNRPLHKRAQAAHKPIARPDGLIRRTDSRHRATFPLPSR